MKTVTTIILVVLILLAASSGVTKVMLMPQDVDFFGKYGFSNPMLIAYGIVQIVGSILMVFQRFRLMGAVMVALTFLISLALLLMSGNLSVGIVTVIAILLLGLIMVQSWKSTA